MCTHTQSTRGNVKVPLKGYAGECFETGGVWFCSVSKLRIHRQPVQLTWPWVLETACVCVWWCVVVRDGVACAGEVVSTSSVEKNSEAHRLLSQVHGVSVPRSVLCVPIFPPDSGRHEEGHVIGVMQLVNKVRTMYLPACPHDCYNHHPL